MFLDDGAHRAANAFRFVAIKARGFDPVFQLCLGRIRIIFRRAIFLKQRRRDHIYPPVGGLRGENCRYKQLQRVTKIQLAMRIGINLRPGFDQLRDALPSCHLVIILQACYGIQFNDGQISGGTRRSAAHCHA